MEKTALDRAKIALGLKNDKELAQTLDVTTSTIHGYKTRGGSIPLEQCIKIVRMTGISLDWLVLGEGTPPDDTSSKTNPATIAVPLYDITASAGNGCTFDDERIISHLHFQNDWLHNAGLYPKNLVCLGVKGDSMEPTLKSGDTILVNFAKKNGDGIFVIRIGDQLRIKRLQWLANGTIKIISDNTIYDTEIINPIEIDDFFEIIGACHTRIGLVQ